MQRARATLLTSTVAALAAGAVVPATARADRPVTTAMAKVADAAAACAALRDALPEDLACTAVGKAKLARLGEATVAALETDTLVRYQVVAQVGGQAWRSPVLALPKRVCAEGTCERIDKRSAKVRAVKIGGKPAVALELTLGYVTQGPDGKDRRWQQYQLLACGGDAAQPVCVEASAGERDLSCTAKLGGDGALIRSCATPLPSLAADIDIDSHAILARVEGPGPVEIKHVLIAWDALAATYRGALDPRAARRSNALAAALAQQVAAALAKDPSQIAALMKEHSEDPGSADDGRAYTVEADAPFVDEFKALALRLDVGEVGVVKTRYGYHVMLRVAAAPPDPLESTAILARTATAARVKVKHVLLSWDGLSGTGDPRGAHRSRAQLEALVKKLQGQLGKGAAIEQLMKQYSEDPGTADSGEPYEVTTDARLVAPFKALSLRLKVGEVGVVKTTFGLHLVKRVE